MPGYCACYATVVLSILLAVLLVSTLVPKEYLFTSKAREAAAPFPPKTELPDLVSQAPVNTTINKQDLVLVGEPNSQGVPPAISLRLLKEVQLVPRQECVAWVTQRPSNNGLGHSHADRNNALMLALKFRPHERLCYAYMPLGDSYHAKGEIFEKFFNFSHAFPQVSEVVAKHHPQRVVVRAKQMGKAAQEIRKHLRKNTLYFVNLEMQVDHCLSAPVWRALYWAQRRRANDVPPLTTEPCFVVAVHIRPREGISPKREVLPQYYVRVLQRAIALIHRASPKRAVCTYLLTGKGRFDTAAVQRGVPGLRVVTNISVTHTFHHDAAADVLVTSKSGFDHTNAMFSLRSTIKLCVPMWLHTGCDDTWITTNEQTGHFDERRFLRVWNFFHAHEAS